MSVEKKINFKLLNKFLIPIFFVYFFLITPSTLPNFYPMFIDSGTYAYVACQINKGKLLYRDVFEIKLPAIYYIYAFFFKIFPDSRWTLYFIDILSTILILFFIYKILNHFKEEKFFWAFAIFYLTCYRVYPSYCDGNLNEHWYLFFYLFFYYLILKEKDKFKDFIAGISFSMLFFLKQSYLILNLTSIFLFRKRLKSLYFILGFIPLTLFFYFIILKGFPESIKAILIFPLRRYGEESVPLLVRLKEGSTYGPFIQFLFLPILAMIKDTELRPFIVLSFFSLFFITFSLPLFYFHYLILLNLILLPSFIICIKKYPEKFVLILLIFLTILPFKFIKIRFKHSIKAIKLTFVENDLRTASPPMTFTIIAHIKENDKFIMIPTYPEIYFLTKTESPYRFFIFDEFVANFYKNEFKKMIRDNPPDFIYLERDISFFEKMFDLEKKEYIIEKVDENFYKFKLK